MGRESLLKVGESMDHYARLTAVEKTVQNLSYLVESQNGTLRSLNTAAARAITEKELQAAIRLCIAQMEEMHGLNNPERMKPFLDEINGLRDTLGIYVRKDDLKTINGRLNQLSDYMHSVASDLFSGQFESFTRQLAVKANAEAVDAALRGKVDAVEFSELSERMQRLDGLYGRLSSKSTSQAESVRQELLSLLHEKTDSIFDELANQRRLLGDAAGASSHNSNDLAAVLARLADLEGRVDSAEAMAKRAIDLSERMAAQLESKLSSDHQNGVTNGKDGGRGGKSGSSGSLLNKSLRGTGGVEDRLGHLESLYDELAAGQDVLRREIRGQEGLVREEVTRATDTEKRIHKTLGAEIEELRVQVNQQGAHLDSMGRQLDGIHGPLSHEITNARSLSKDVMDEIRRERGRRLRESSQGENGSQRTTPTNSRPVSANSQTRPTSAEGRNRDGKGSYSARGGGLGTPGGHGFSVVQEGPYYSYSYTSTNQAAHNAAGGQGASGADGIPINRVNIVMDESAAAPVTPRDAHVPRSLSPVPQTGAPLTPPYSPPGTPQGGRPTSKEAERGRRAMPQKSASTPQRTSNSPRKLSNSPPHSISPGRPHTGSSTRQPPKEVTSHSGFTSAPEYAEWTHDQTLQPQPFVPRLSMKKTPMGNQLSGFVAPQFEHPLQQTISAHQESPPRSARPPTAPPNAVSLPVVAGARGSTPSSAPQSRPDTSQSQRQKLIPHPPSRRGSGTAGKLTLAESVNMIRRK